MVRDHLPIYRGTEIARCGEVRERFLPSFLLAFLTDERRPQGEGAWRRGRSGLFRTCSVLDFAGSALRVCRPEGMVGARERVSSQGVPSVLAWPGLGFCCRVAMYWPSSWGPVFGACCLFLPVTGVGGLVSGRENGVRRSKYGGRSEASCYAVFRPSSCFRRKLLGRVRYPIIRPLRM